MALKRGLATFAAVIAAPALIAPMALASAPTIPVTQPVVMGPSCPDNYSGPTNLATGCPWWMMTYRVAYPEQPSPR
jgi:hypothetical protein